MARTIGVKRDSNRRGYGPGSPSCADGLIISNHGGRQLDAAESSVNSPIRLAKTPGYKQKMKIMPDCANAINMFKAKRYQIMQPYRSAGRRTSANGWPGKANCLQDDRRFAATYGSRFF